MKLSNQAMGAIMMALQKSLLEQTDIVPVLESFDFKLGEADRLFVSNPPNFEVPTNTECPEDNYFSDENNTTVGSD